MATRLVVALISSLGLAACSPGRIAADGETGSDGGSGSVGESDDGPIVETGTDDQSGDGDGDGDGDPWGGGCDREGSLKWLDICEPRDPCDSTVCDDGQACLGGQCVAPKPSEPCEGVELMEHALAPSVGDDDTPLRLADIDGLPGDELIGAVEGVIEVVRAGELVVSATLPDDEVGGIHPLQLDADEHTDLLVYSSYYQDPYAVLLSGEGNGHFALSLTQLAGGLAAPFPIDFDNDGDHDLLGWLDADQANLYRNDAGALTLLASFGFDGRLGGAVDLDLDGFVDDALFGEYPSPIALRGEGGQLLEAGSLPEPPRGPEFHYGIGRPAVADLDGDGWVEVVSILHDGLERVGARVWWGLPGNAFAEPRDQLLADDIDPYTAGAYLVGFAELDGAAPLELVVATGEWLGYARPNLAEQLPFSCFSRLLEPSQVIWTLPSVGDLDADGQLELAFRDYLDAAVYTAVAVP